MTQPKQILLLIATHQRPTTTRICFEGVRRLMFRSKHRIEPLILVSDTMNGLIAKGFGFETVWTENNPQRLGSKFNKGLGMAILKDWDYLLQLGSDDLLHDRAIELLDEAIDNDWIMAGFTKLYVFQMISGKMKRITAPFVFGAGRLIRRDNIEWVFNEVGTLWPDDIGQGLDNASQDRLMDMPGNQVRILDYKEPWPLVIDLKDGSNIHAFDSFEYGKMQNGTSVDAVSVQERRVFMAGCPEI